MKRSKKDARRLEKRTQRDESVYSSIEWKAATKRPKPAPKGWRSWGEKS